MVHPAHLWPADLSAEQRGAIRRLFEQRGLQLTALNMPNIDINVAAGAGDAQLFAQPFQRNGAARRRAWRARRGDRPGRPTRFSGAEKSCSDISSRRSTGSVRSPSGRHRAMGRIRPVTCPAVGGLMEALTRYGITQCASSTMSPTLISSAKISRWPQECQARLALVHLSDTGREIYRHDAVGLGTVPFAEVPHALAAVGYTAGQCWKSSRAIPTAT